MNYIYRFLISMDRCMYNCKRHKFQQLQDKLGDTHFVERCLLPPQCSQVSLYISIGVVVPNIIQHLFVQDRLFLTSLRYTKLCIPTTVATRVGGNRQD